MKHTSSHIIKTTPESRELAAFALNNEAIDKEITAAATYFAKKMKKGIFDEAKAIARLYPVANHAARLYSSVFGGCYYKVFNVTARYTAAAEIVEYARELAADYLTDNEI